MTPQQQVIYPCNVRVMNMQMTSSSDHMCGAGTSGTGGHQAHPLTNWFSLPDAKWK